MLKLRLRRDLGQSQARIGSKVPYQNTNTSIPYIARPSADRFNNFPVPGSSLVSFQKNRPGRMNETVVDPVEPTKERTAARFDQPSFEPWLDEVAHPFADHRQSMQS